MMRCLALFGGAIGLIGLLGLVTGTAEAQPTKADVGAVVTMVLSDPTGTSEPWRVQRELLRTFSDLRACENQKEAFIGVHLRGVAGHGLITPGGVPPVIEVESIECFELRQ